MLFARLVLLLSLMLGFLGCSDAKEYDQATSVPVMPQEVATPGEAPAHEVVAAPVEPRNWEAEVAARLAGSGPQGSMAPADVAAVKAATVLVRTGRGSGSGFLFHQEADGSFLVATNHHVIAGLPEGAPLDVVLDSGSPQQQQMEARAFAMDPDADLAVLRIGQPSRSRAPLQLALSDSVFETQPVIVAGFPFGEILARSGLPAPTLGRGSVSSLRYDDKGELFRVQLDADVNPGNSGGPVLSSSGQVVGVAVETVTTTNISFMVPISSLHNLLSGYLVSLRFEVDGDARNKLVTVDFDLRDPLGRVSRLGVNLVGVEADIPEVRRGVPYPRVGRQIATKPPNGESTRLRVRVPPQSGDKVFLQPWFDNPRGGKSFAPFRVSLLDTGHQSGELSWDAAVKQGWTDDAPKWLSGGDVPLSGDWLEPEQPQGPEVVPDVIAETSFAPKRTSAIEDAVASLLLTDAKELLPNLHWSSDGSAFFALTKAGALHRVSLDGFRETNRVRLFEEVSSMVMSKRGLLVAVPGSQIVRIIDERDLRTLQSVRVPGVWRIASAPALDVAFSTGRSSPNDLAVVDLRRRRVARSYNAREVQANSASVRKHPSGVVLSEFDQATVAPNGEYLFVEGFECLHRFRIEGTRLRYEEMGPRIGSGRIEISADSRYLTVAGVMNSNAIKNHPPMKTGSLPIYRLENILDPVRVATVGRHPRAFAFDVVGARLLGHGYNRPLITISGRGETKDYELPVARNSRVRQILAHPLSRGALVLTDKELWWVSWS